MRPPAFDPQEPTGWLEEVTDLWLDRFAGLVLGVRANPSAVLDALLDGELLRDGEARAMLAALIPELGREEGPAAVAVANRLSRTALRVAGRAKHVPAVRASVSDLAERSSLFMVAVAFVLLDADDDGLAGA